MTDIWTHAGNNAGSHMAPVRKLTLHTTEGSSIEGAIGAYGSNNGWPQKTIDYRQGRRRCCTHLPLTVAARTLKNTSTHGQTNRAGTVQYELVGSAAKILDQMTEADWLALGRDHVGPDCRSIGVPLVCQVAFAPPNRSVRMTHAQIDRVQGLVGHQHWPENDHTDPGDLTAKRYRGGTGSAVDLILEGAGATKTTNNPTTGGFLMALTDQEQAELLNAVRDIKAEVKVVHGDTGNIAKWTLETLDRVRKLPQQIADALAAAKK